MNKILDEQLIKRKRLNITKRLKSLIQLSELVNIYMIRVWFQRNGKTKFRKKVKWKDKRIASDVDLNVMSLGDKQDDYMESKQASNE